MARRDELGRVFAQANAEPSVESAQEEVMIDLEYIKCRKDSLTEFVPTKMDLVSLANSLADYIICHESNMRICAGPSGRSTVNAYHYDCFRLGRILDYLPELESEIKEKLKRGFEKNEAFAAEVTRTSEKPERPESFSPF